MRATRYFTVGADGLAPLKDKRPAQTVFTDLAVAYARRTGAPPPHTTAEDAVLTYHLRPQPVRQVYPQARQGGRPRSEGTFVAGLRAAPPPRTPTKVDEDTTP